MKAPGADKSTAASLFKRISAQDQAAPTPISFQIVEQPLGHVRILATIESPIPAVSRIIFDASCVTSIIAHSLAFLFVGNDEVRVYDVFMKSNNVVAVRKNRINVFGLVISFPDNIEDKLKI